jgi:putative hydrolase of the HAD superfamily
MSRYKGLIFDFGGVVTVSVRDWIGTYCAENGVDLERFRYALVDDAAVREAHHRLERGEIDEREFEPMFGAALGVEDPTGLVARLIEFLVLDEKMVEVVRAARRHGIRTGLVSNSFGDDRYDHALFDELFDGVVISMHAGMRKPEPGIYLLGAERTGVAPAEAVFVDDIKANCEGAEAVGMTAVLHGDPDETILRLEELFGVSFRPAGLKLPHRSA